MKKQTVRDLTHIAIVAALYVVLTVVPPFNLISYGPSLPVPNCRNVQSFRIL